MSHPPEKLFNRNFLLLCQGMFISIFGSQAYYIAESLLVMHHTGSGSMVGLVLAVSALPHLLFGAVGGVFADRYDRKQIIVICDVLAGLACLFLSVYLWQGEGDYLIPAVMIAGFLLNTLLCFFGPSGRALIPMLVPSHSLIKANSFYKTLKNIASIAGQALAGVAYTLAGPAVLFAVDGISYILSALSESLIGGTTKVSRPKKAEKSDQSSVWSELKEGIKVTTKVPGLVVLISTLAVMDLFLAPLMTFLPFFVEHSLSLDSSWFGFMFAALSVGAVIGSSLSGVLKIPDHLSSYILPLFLAGTGLSRMLIGISTNPWLVFLFIASETATAVFFSIRAEAAIQEKVEAGFLGRVLGLLGTLMGVFTPLGMALGGLLVDLAKERLGQYIAASGLMLTAIALLSFMNRDYRKFFEAGNGEEVPQPLRNAEQGGEAL